jgi:hypothetical protein
MTTVENLIGHLLLRHNCVIVPSFGGFVAKQVSARIDYASNKIVPPSKTLLFNKQLINNDGLLINELSLANDVSFDIASAEVKNKVRGWQEALKKGQRIELDCVGYLYANEEKNICFEQDRFFNLLLESYGLGTVQFFLEESKAVVTETAHPELVSPIAVEDKPTFKETDLSTEIEETLVINHPVIEENRKLKVWKYIAAACFLPIAFYSIWIPTKTDILESGMISFNDFNPFHKTAQAEYEKQSLSFESEPERKHVSLQEKVSDLPSEIEVYTYKYDDELYIPVAIEKEKIEIVETTSLKKESDFEAELMHFIVGCFRKESNAVNLVSKLKASGMNAKIIDIHNGLRRVSAGSGLSMESIFQIREEASALGFAGWTLK